MAQASYRHHLSGIPAEKVDAVDKPEVNLKRNGATFQRFNPDMTFEPSRNADWFSFGDL